MEERGGISVVHGEREEILPLPIGGIMSDAEGEKVARDYERLNQIAKEMGCRMAAPFMLISFMALLVIPSLKMSDLGLFDADIFEFVEQQNDPWEEWAEKKSFLHLINLYETGPS